MANSKREIEVNEIKKCIKKYFVEVKILKNICIIIIRIGKINKSKVSASNLVFVIVIDESCIQYASHSLIDVKM
jgi:hypothetical protein